MRKTLIKTKLFSFMILMVMQIIFSQNKNEQTKLNWLVGIWENQTVNGPIYEKWIYNKDYNEYLGKSYLIKNKDTLVLETIKVAYIKGDLYYIPIVANQNQGKEVYFKVTLLQEKSFIIENNLHDFPQKISYSQIKNDSLIAEISGTKNNIEKKISFRMKKIK